MRRAYSHILFSSPQSSGWKCWDGYVFSSRGGGGSYSTGQDREVLAKGSGIRRRNRKEPIAGYSCTVQETRLVASLAGLPNPCPYHSVSNLLWFLLFLIHVCVFSGTEKVPIFSLHVDLLLCHSWPNMASRVLALSPVAH